MVVTVLRVLNNSVVLAQDNEHELLIRGKGIAFGLHSQDTFTPPESAKISYLNNNERVQNVIDQVDDDILSISELILAKAQHKIGKELSPLLLLTLADHLDNAIKDAKSDHILSLNDAIIYETEHLYQIEFQIGKESVAYIKKRLGVNLPNYEAGFIALHIVNSEIINGGLDRVQEISELTKACVIIIQKNFDMLLNKDTVAFSKFVTHLRYLIERQGNDSGESGDYHDDIGTNLLGTLKSMYADSYRTAEAIAAMLSERKGWTLGKNEVVYLIIHVHRLIETNGN